MYLQNIIALTSIIIGYYAGSYIGLYLREYIYEINFTIKRLK